VRNYRHDRRMSKRELYRERHATRCSVR
jgi:hypothetical protein